MALSDRLRNLFAPNRNLYNDAFFKLLGSGNTNYDTKAGTYLEKGYLYNPDVYSVIQQQSIKHASIPREIKIIEDTKAKRQIDNLRMATKGNLSPQQHLRKLSLEAKAYKQEYLSWPLDRPNPMQTWQEIFALEKLYLRTTGNVYYYDAAPEEGANAGVPIARYILPSQSIQIVLKKGVGQMDFLSQESPVDHYMLIEGNKYVTFPASQITHVKYINPMADQNGSHLYGVSPLRSALRNIQTSNLAIDNNKKAMSNSGVFGFIFGKANALTSDQAKELKDRMLEMDANPDRLSKIAGVSAEIDFKRISLTTDELKPFDFLNFDQKSICNVLGWSTVLLNSDRKGDYGGTILAEQKRVITDNIMPDNDLLNEAWQNGFIRKFKGYENAVLESLYDDLPEMQNDQKTLMEWLERAINIGVMTRNEGREALKLIAIDDEQMNTITVREDIIPLSEAIANQF